MAELLINQWEGIGNDEYLQQGSELFDCRDIDFSSSRRIRSVGAYNRAAAYRTGASQYGLKKFTKNSYTSVFSYTDDAKIWDGTTLRSIGYGSHTHITVGSGNGVYSEIPVPGVSSPYEIRHFFFPNGVGRIVYTNYNGTTIATIDTSTIPRMNDTSSPPGASCYLWKGALIFSYGNIIYDLNPSLNTPALPTEKIVLPNGARVQHLAYFGGMIWIIYQINGKNSTIIQGCTYDGVTYKLNNYNIEIAGQVCIGATTEASTIYWVSERSINEFNGSQNTVVKTLYERSGINDYFYSQSGGTENMCAYNNGFLRITGTNKIYSYGNKRTGYKKNLTEIKLDTGYEMLALGNDGSGVTHDSGNHRITTVDSTYNASSYVITMPYTAGRYGINKSGLSIRVGYNLKKTNGGSIKISIMTDKMIRNYGYENYPNYIEIANITDATKTYIDITSSMIATALATQSYSNEFALMKLKVEIFNGGVAASYNGEVRYSNSPEVFDLYISHDEVK